MIQGYHEVLGRALTIARERYPTAPVYKRVAFANAMAHALTGLNGGFEPRDTAEETAAKKYCPHNSQSPISFEEAVEKLIGLDGPIFGSGVL
ncbi:MAG: hypothetical protein Q7S34_00600 [bacterium]|nr:hypothetical protein [bacterium]